jgi:hypothetical protein
MFSRNAQLQCDIQLKTPCDANEAEASTSRSTATPREDETIPILSNHRA